MQNVFSIAASDLQWLEWASEAVLNVLGPPRADSWAVTWELRDDAVTSIDVTASSERARRFALHFPGTTPSDGLLRGLRAGLTTVTASGLWTEASRELFHEMRCGDAVAAAFGEPDAGVVIGYLLSKRAPHPPAKRRALAPVIRSVSIAWRARRTLRLGQAAEMADAILSPTGRVVYASLSARDSVILKALRAAVALRERERVRPTKGVPGAAIWSELVSGRWSLIDDYEDGGQRHVLAVRNDAYADAFMLSTAEARAIELTVLGRSPKQMVDDLGLSLPRVYALRQSALSKLSAGSLADVITLVRELPGTLFARIPLGQEALIALRAPAFARDLPELTDAERDVSCDLLRALPLREIARRRGRSLRTVANQVRSIYRKLGVANRDEFLTLTRMGTKPGPEKRKRSLR